MFSLPGGHLRQRLPSRWLSRSSPRSSPSTIIRFSMLFRFIFQQDYDFFRCPRFAFTRFAAMRQRRQIPHARQHSIARLHVPAFLPRAIFDCHACNARSPSSRATDHKGNAVAKAGFVSDAENIVGGETALCRRHYVATNQNMSQTGAERTSYRTERW